MVIRKRATERGITYLDLQSRQRYSGPKKDFNTVIVNCREAEPLAARRISMYVLLSHRSLLVSNIAPTPLSG